MDRRGVALAAALTLAACVKKQDEAGKPTPGPGTAPTGATAPPPTTAPIAVTDVASAKAALGKRVRIAGTADNAKLGAIVLVGDLVVFCTDRAGGWDERNQPIVVEGTLTYDEGQPAPTPGPNGEQSAGAAGGFFRMDCNVVGG